MHNLGTHIRLVTNFTDIIQKALRLNVPIFQTFFTFSSGKHIKLNEPDIKNFLSLRKKYFSNLYVHGSYWINLCIDQNIGYKILEHEISMAKKLEFTHIILHPGSANNCRDKLEGIENLARSLNKILKKENDITIMLENTAHGGLSIGGDLNDFKFLLSKLDQPEKLFFCIDTAHAYAYGYDIANLQEQEIFIELIENTIGKDKILLIHLNDTDQKVGLKIDKHDIPGHGNIGQKALNKILKNKYFENAAKIIELPNNIEEHKEKEIIEKIKNWD